MCVSSAARRSWNLRRINQLQSKLKCYHRRIINLVYEVGRLEFTQLFNIANIKIHYYSELSFSYFVYVNIITRQTFV
jgi:hypothetical protein